MGTAVTAAGKKTNMTTALIVNAWIQNLPKTMLVVTGAARCMPGRETASATTRTTIALAIGTAATAVARKAKSNTRTARNAPASTTRSSVKDDASPTSSSKAMGIATMPITTAPAIGMAATVVTMDLQI